MSRRTVMLGRVSSPRAGRPPVTVVLLPLFTVEKAIPELAMRAGDRLAVDARGRVHLTRIVPNADVMRASAIADAERSDAPAEVTP